MQSSCDMEDYKSLRTGHEVLTVRRTISWRAGCEVLAVRETISPSGPLTACRSLCPSCWLGPTSCKYPGDLPAACFLTNASPLGERPRAPVRGLAQVAAGRPGNVGVSVAVCERPDLWSRGRQGTFDGAAQTAHFIHAVPALPKSRRSATASCLWDPFLPWCAWPCAASRVGGVVAMSTRNVCENPVMAGRTNKQPCPES